MSAKRISIVVIGSMMLFSVASYSAVPNLNIYTESFEPYSFDKDGKIQGIAVEIMIEILKRVGSTQTLKDIKLVPWTLGYKSLETEKNALLFPTTKTDERLKQFKWVCSIAERKTELVGLKKSAIQISSTAEMKKYKFSAVTDDVGEQLIKAAGVPDEMIERAADYTSNIKKLYTGRAQLTATSLENAQSYAEISGMNPDDLESVFLIDTSYLCYAFNKGVDEATITTFQKAMDAIVADGTHAKLTAKYR